MSSSTGLLVGFFVLAMPRKKTTEEFKIDLKKAHGDKISFEGEYKGQSEKGSFKCKLHGNFEALPKQVLRGHGCGECAKQHLSLSLGYGKEGFVKRAREVHGDRYSYTESIYKNNNSRVDILCKEHGEFSQVAYSHLQGRGCPKCSIETKKIKLSKNKKDFIKDIEKVHGDIYGYDTLKYKNNKTKVELTCPVHGPTLIHPSALLRGACCPKCSYKERGERGRIKPKDYFNLVKGVHNNKYSYDENSYTLMVNRIKVFCSIHGEFNPLASMHFYQATGCPKCANESSTSKGEQEVLSFLSNREDFVINSDRTILDNKELDIVIPGKKVAIEYNGLYWHSDKVVHKDYHSQKTLEAGSKGYQLIHIFEDEWENKPEIVKSRLLNILGKTTNKIYARKCEIKEVPTKEATDFLDKNHIQGRLGASVKIGLYYENSLVSLMTFGKFRKNLGREHEEGCYELLRFCNLLDTTVVGGASKLLKYFEKVFTPKKIISYADRRWSQGNLYKALGFDLVSQSKPNYFYFLSQSKGREPRFKYRKSVLVKQGFDQNKTEKQIMEERGYSRIYDCGTLLFEKTH